MIVGVLIKAVRDHVNVHTNGLVSRRGYDDDGWKNVVGASYRRRGGGTPFRVVYGTSLPPAWCCRQFVIFIFIKNGVDDNIEKFSLCTWNTVCEFQFQIQC